MLVNADCDAHVICLKELQLQQTCNNEALHTLNTRSSSPLQRMGSLSFQHNIHGTIFSFSLSPVPREFKQPLKFLEVVLHLYFFVSCQLSRKDPGHVWKKREGVR